VKQGSPRQWQPDYVSHKHLNAYENPLSLFSLQLPDLEFSRFHFSHLTSLLVYRMGEKGVPSVDLMPWPIP